MWVCGCVWGGCVCGCVCVRVCVRGRVYMCICLGWLGCVRRVGIYWKEGRRETTPLYHICYIKFISSLKKIYPINLIKMTKLGNKKFKCSKQKGRLYLQYRYYFTEPYTYFLVGMTQKEREEGPSHTLLTVRFITYQHNSLLSNILL